MPYRPPQVPLATARYHAFKAHSEGSDASNLAGNCSRPIDRELRGVQALLPKQLAAIRDDPFVDYADGYGWLPGREPRPAPPATHTVVVRVRCRKCPECLDQKRRQWTARGIQEVRQSPRTWFGTLTVAPEYRFWAKARAEATCEQRRSERWPALSPSEQTKALAAILMPEVTRWLKRVRKQSKARFRYLLVCEAHADGFPHFHLLLHELDQQVSKRLLEAQWKYGFSNWRLIPPGEVRQVGYVCKYLTKSAQTRIRASRNYGQPDLGLLNGALATLLTSLKNEGKKEETVCLKGGKRGRSTL